MDIHQPLALLGGMSAQRFMQRHWQRKPLLIRQAIAGFAPPLDRAALFALAQSEAVESRLIIGASATKGWQLRHGPFARRALPPLKRPDWTLLVQGVDLHDQAVHELLNRFRFVPDARLDDVMVSYATEGGGVGPHFDSYDVFLLQAHGQRRWRIGRQKDQTLQQGQPLKILQNFVAEQEFVLSPGDMLYLPPGYAHDGVALDECMTYSIGFRAPGRGEVAAEMLQRLAQDAPDMVSAQIYRDAGQDAVATPGAIPPAMLEFARQALEQALRDPMVLARNLGEHLTEPKPLVWFTETSGATAGGAVRLDRRTRMMYDQHHVFINGEGFRAGGRDARLMQVLADTRRLDARMCASVSSQAKDLLQSWLAAGWLHGE
ncbi:MAG: cupin domain-containing protein [Rhodoferax sp.]|nr:cupin domain-containing protein [Rhodoferax sp.]MBP9929347.1 cupin domain-containing protein [Rhodoferax sp.]HQX60903.1 cupin domain-containing protein [Burkholderiaceae bacterium]HQZ06078.1 cupin domain-containing protein [Burkholderiaceae bacterium]HRA63071.1 cupin domain-containing protein [Burkholderiaceae bacterium]